MLEILRERDVACDVIEYLRHPLDRATLGRILDRLPDPPGALVRRDKRFAALGLRGSDYTTRERVVALLLEHPELMERPVVVGDGCAVIARPAERVLEIL